MKSFKNWALILITVLALASCEGMSKSGRHAIVLRNQTEMLKQAGLKRVYSPNAAGWATTNLDHWSVVGNKRASFAIDHDSVVYLYTFNDHGKNWIFETKFRKDKVLPEPKSVLDSAAMARHGLKLFNGKRS